MLLRQGEPGTPQYIRVNKEFDLRATEFKNTEGAMTGKLNEVT